MWIECEQQKNKFIYMILNFFKKKVRVFRLEGSLMSHGRSFFKKIKFLALRK